MHRLALPLAALALLAAPPAVAAPGTTEKQVHITAKRLAFEGEDRLRLRLTFDRRPVRLEQVQIGIHVLDPVRANGSVRGRRWTGTLQTTPRTTWKAGRTYPLLVIFCPQREAGTASAAKGGCTWIRSTIYLRRR